MTTCQNGTEAHLKKKCGELVEAALSVSVLLITGLSSNQRQSPTPANRYLICSLYADSLAACETLCVLYVF